MAIQFARIEIVGRSSGGSACCKSAYNARAKIKDQQTNVIYNFSNRGDNVFHEVLLPDYADLKFKNLSEFMNLIERSEKRKDSQLLKDIVLALPDDKELSLQDRIEITKLLIMKRGWVKEGLGVQVDIHKPHDGEKNWHAHLLVTTRRFTKDGLSLDVKAVDLNPGFKKAGNKAYIIPEDQQIHEDLKEIINDHFKGLDLGNRVDSIGINPQEHIGPVRMRSILNQIMDRNEARRIAEIEYLSTGAAVLDKVTRHMSVFSRGDLIRAVKCIDNIEIKERLVEQALRSSSLIALYTEDGAKTQYFTTQEVRLEESKILRLSGYVTSNANVLMVGKSRAKQTQQLISESKDNLSDEQHKALSELGKSNTGFSILRGRAGVGKSHVLHRLAAIAKASDINVIGLAPTHKAKEVLGSSGFERCDTVKGMLFKLANGRFSLPKHSLLVVDEAGMIGNEDYHELLRVAATRKCTVILSGDERQLTSVQRGGMFEIFAGKYGSSTILDIKRQQAPWGKSVAMAFSKGDVRSGISILTQEKRIKREDAALKSMQSLLADWHNSKEDISNRLILAVKNKDVAALNHGARQYLKSESKLTGSEIEVDGNHYMKGDLILIGKTEKSLGVTNGEIGKLLEVSRSRFVVSLQNTGSRSNINKDSDRIIEFNPVEYSSFRHSYATTVFKAQGASIKDVYVFHDGFAGLKNGYVALSRNINELNLYINNKTTPTASHLIRQLLYDPEQGSSLNYYTEQDCKTLKQNGEFLKNIGWFDRALLITYDFAARNITELRDKYIPKSEYYNYREPLKSTESVSQVIDKVYAQSQDIALTEDVIVERLVVGRVTENSRNIRSNHGSKDVSIHNSDLHLSDTLNKIKVAINSTNINHANTDTKTNVSSLKQSVKTRFYTNADYIRDNRHKDIMAENLKSNRDNGREALRKKASIYAERIARDLLGEPNKRLSNGKELRFGKSGGLAVRISGEKAGSWYDFEQGRGGDMFDLVREKQVCNFKSAVDYLRGSLGIESGLGISVSAGSSHLCLVHDHENSDITVRYIKEQEAKQVAANKLYNRSKLVEDTSVSHRYLTEVRGITCELGADIKEARLYDKEKQLYLPAVIAYARDDKGKITGGRQILLDDKTAKLADVAVPKKSFGRISGSFVDVSSRSENSQRSLVNSEVEKHKITILAEGLETALSVKQTMVNNPSNRDKEFKVICSLDINNIKNYKPEKNEKIIIAADNDGYNAVTNKVIENVSFELTFKGAFVEIVCPNKKGDFNDVLQDKALGEKEIQSIFDRALAKHCAVTLKEYFIDKKDAEFLSKEEKAYINYIYRFKIDESQIVDAYRTDPMQGRQALEQSKASLEIANFYYKQNKEVLLETKQWGYGVNEIDAIKDIQGMDKLKADSFYREKRDEYLSKSLEYNIASFHRLKKQATNIFELKKAITAEQQHLKETYKSLRVPVQGRQSLVSDHLRSAEFAENEPDLLSKTFVLADKLILEYRRPESEVCRDLSSSTNTKHLYVKFNKSAEFHKVKSTITEFNTKIRNAPTVFKVIEALDDKQKFCAGLYQNLKYPEDQDYFKKLTEFAIAAQVDKIPEKLLEAVHSSLTLGIYSEGDLLKELKTTRNSRNTYIKLDKKVEVERIAKTLIELNKTKSESPNRYKTIEFLGTKDKFLAGLKGNLKYPEIHSNSLIQSIENAYMSEQKNNLKHLDKISVLHINQVGTKPLIVNEILKASQDSHSAFNTLQKCYHSHIMEQIHKSLKVIDSGKIVRLDDKSFNCPIEFLDHVIETRTHEYFPHKEVNQIHAQILTRQKQLLLSKEFESPSL